MVIDMKMLILYEINKFFKNKKNLIIIALFFLASAAMMFYNINQNEDYMDTMGRGYTDKSRYSSGLAGTLNTILEFQGYVDGESVEHTLKRVDYYTEEANYLKGMGYFYSENKEKDFKFINVNKNKLYTSMLNAFKEDVITLEEVEKRGYTPRKIEQLSQYTKYLIDKDIQPMINLYEINGANGIVMFLKGVNLIICIFLIALLSVDIYLGEVSEGSYKLSFTQPHERKYIFFSKVIVITGVSVALILVTAALNFVVFRFLGGMGNWQYPMMAKESLMMISFNSLASELLILPLWKYVLMGFLLLLLLTLFTVMLVLYISISTDSNSKTMGILVMLIFLAFIFGSFSSESSVVNLWYPHSYLFMEKVIGVQNRSNYAIGILINTIGSIILFILSFLKFKNKDFLGAVD